MNNTIALTQFVFLSLGIMALNIIVKITHQPSPFARFLAGQGWWLVLLPLGWVVYDRVCRIFNKGIFQVRFATASGILLAAAILACYAFAIFFPTGQ